MHNFEVGQRVRIVNSTADGGIFDGAVGTITEFNWFIRVELDTPMAGQDTFLAFPNEIESEVITDE